VSSSQVAAWVILWWNEDSLEDRHEMHFTATDLSLRLFGRLSLGRFEWCYFKGVYDSYGD
jgi:hypothetical protein